jgi:hypothetical protein
LEDHDGGEDIELVLRSGQAVMKELGRGREAAWAEQRSIILEQRVIDFVREHMAAFKDPSNKLYLQLLPKGSDKTYSVRFGEEVWKGLDKLVKEVIESPQYRPTWEPVESAHTALTNDTGGDAIGKGRKPVSNITRALCSNIQAIPEVKENPALKDDSSYIELAAIIDHAVLEWAAKRCRRALSRKETDDGRPLSAEEIRRVGLDGEKYEELLRGLHEDPAQPHGAMDVLRASEPDLETESQTAGAAAGKHYEGNRPAIRHPLPSTRITAASPHSPRSSKETPRTPQVSRHGPSRGQHTRLASDRHRRSTGHNSQKSQRVPPSSAASAQMPAWAAGIAATSGKRR